MWKKHFLCKMTMNKVGIRKFSILFEVLLTVRNTPLKTEKKYERITLTIVLFVRLYQSMSDIFHKYAVSGQNQINNECYQS